MMFTNFLRSDDTLDKEALLRWWELEKHKEVFLAIIQDLRLYAQKISNEDKLEESLALLDAGEWLAIQAALPLAQALIWRGRANVYQSYDKLEKSREAIAAEVKILEVHGSDFDIAQARTLDVYLLGVLEQFDEAIELAHWIRPIFEEKGFTLGEAAVTANLTRAYIASWQFELAEKECLKAKQLYEKLQATGRLAKVLFDSGYVAEKLNRWDKAESSFLEAQSLLFQENDLLNYVRVVMNRAALRIPQAKYDDALHLLHSARGTLSGQSDFVPIAYIDFYEGKIRRLIGQSSQAKVLLNRALGTFEQWDRKSDRIRVLDELSQICAEEGTQDSLSQGLAHVEKAYQIVLVLNKPLLTATFLLRKSEFALSLNRIHEANKQAMEAKEIFAENGLSFDEAHCLLVLADCTFQSDPELARRYYQDALNLIEKDMPLLAARCWQGLGRIAMIRDEYTSAENAYVQSIKHIEHIHNAIKTHTYQARFLAGYESVFNELLAVLHSDKKLPQRIVKWTEYYKSISQNSFWSLEELTVDDNPELSLLLKKRDEIRISLDFQTSKMYAESLNFKLDLQRGQVAFQSKKSLEQLTGLRLELQNLEDRIARFFGMDKDYEKDDLPKLSHLISDDELLVSYYPVGKKLFAFSASSTEKDVLIHEVGESWQNIQVHIESTTKLMSKSGIPALLVQRELSRLWKSLVSPLQERLLGKKRLIILPYGQLYLVPFAALYDNEKQSYLIENWHVRYSPSLKILEKCQQTEPAQGPLLLYGQSGKVGTAGFLPAVKDEIQSIKQLFPNASLVIEKAMSKDVLLNKAADCSLIHIASHSYFDMMNTHESGILLSEGHWLRLADLYLQRNMLKGNSIVLSSCESARNLPTGGSNLGLTNGLLFSGAKTVISGLWKVDDKATALLMKNLYSQLSTGDTFSSALAQAQLAFINHEIYSHPFYWGAFTLYGTNKSLFEG